MSNETLIAKIQTLPPAARKQVETLVEALADASELGPKPQFEKRFSFDWAGGLEDFKNQFTSVELQHHINGLR